MREKGVCTFLVTFSLTHIEGRRDINANTDVEVGKGNVWVPNRRPRQESCSHIEKGGA